MTLDFVKQSYVAFPLLQLRVIYDSLELVNRAALFQMPHSVAGTLLHCSTNSLTSTRNVTGQRIEIAHNFFQGDF